MDKISNTPVTVCGAGALGANIVENLARQGFKRVRVIDRDRVEERNLSTQPYYRSDIGAFKAKILSNAIYRALGTTVDARIEELNAPNAAKLLAGSDLVIDTIDNSVGRSVVKSTCEEMVFTLRTRRLGNRVLRDYMERELSASIARG